MRRGEREHESVLSLGAMISMRAITNLVVSFLWAALLFISPSLVSADQAQYIYDDLGRLSQVIDGQDNVATYQYDDVGNLLSITRNTGGVGASTITV